MARGGAERGVLRRFDVDKKILTLSELLPTRSRTFQLAHQIALLTQRAKIDRMVDDSHLTSEEARALARVALANYFAGAVILPVRALPRGQPPGTLRHRRPRAPLPRRLRAGLPPADHAPTAGPRRRPVSHDPYRRRRKHFEALQRERDPLRPLRRRVPALERLRRIHDARDDPDSAFSLHGRLDVFLPRPDDSQGLGRVSHPAAGAVHRPRVPGRARAGDRPLARQRPGERPARDARRVSHLADLCERSDCEQRAFPSMRHPLHVDENVRGVSSTLRSPRASQQ